MEIKYHQPSRTLIVKIFSDLDHHMAQKVRMAVDNEFVRKGAKNVVFDLSSLNFMDSSGIGVLMGRYKLAQKSGGRVIVVGATGSVGKMVSMGGITRIISRANSIDTALKSL